MRSPKIRRTPQLRLDQIVAAAAEQLVVDFDASGLLPLPSQKGSVRQKEMATFLQGWLPNRLRCLEGSYAVNGRELTPECDVVIHDAFHGWAWPLSKVPAMHVCAGRHVKAVVEVKSTLDRAEWEKIVAHAKEVGRAFLSEKRPPYFVFAFKKRGRLDDFESDLVYPRTKIDGVFVLDYCAYINKASPIAFALQTAISKGLSLEEAVTDGQTVNAEVGDLVSGRHGHSEFVSIGAKRGDFLTAFVCAIAEAVDVDKNGLVRDLLQFHGDGERHVPFR